MLSKVCFLAVLAVAVAQRRGPIRRGPFGPLDGRSAEDCTRVGEFMADSLNMCWYHRCVATSVNTYELKAEECPLGTRLSYTYTQGIHIPCVHHYTNDVDYECSRERDTDPEGLPACTRNLNCMNGGTLHHMNDDCWCECPKEWSGDSDCSKGINKDLLENPDPSSGKCEGGTDGIDWCALDRRGGCQNGGTCHNQCGGFYCDCVSPFRWGKRCEKFDCTHSRECYNGGICRRGNNANAPHSARRCVCPNGVVGFQCENDLRRTIQEDLLARLQN